MILVLLYAICGIVTLTCLAVWLINKGKPKEEEASIDSVRAALADYSRVAKLLRDHDSWELKYVTLSNSKPTDSDYEYWPEGERGKRWISRDDITLLKKYAILVYDSDEFKKFFKVSVDTARKEFIEDSKHILDKIMVVLEDEE